TPVPPCSRAAQSSLRVRACSPAKPHAAPPLEPLGQPSDFGPTPKFALGPPATVAACAPGRLGKNERSRRSPSDVERKKSLALEDSIWRCRALAPRNNAMATQQPQ